MSQYLILSVGFDPELLRARAAVLRAAGYNVHSETAIGNGRRAFTNGDFDVLILCHTIPEEEKWRIISDVRAIKPSAPVVVMRADGDTGLGDKTVHSLDGPEMLLGAIGEMLARFPNGPISDYAEADAPGPVVQKSEKRGA